MAEIPRGSGRTVCSSPSLTPLPNLILSLFFHHLRIRFPFPPSTSPVYILLLLINFFCFSMHDARPLSLCFCLLREKSASYGFYSLVVPPSRIPLSSPSNQPFFFLLPLSLVSIPYASPLLSFVFSPPSWIARLTLHEAKEQSNFFVTHGYYAVINFRAKLMEAKSKHVNIASLFWIVFPNKVMNVPFYYNPMHCYVCLCYINLLKFIFFIQNIRR